MVMVMETMVTTVEMTTDPKVDGSSHETCASPAPVPSTNRFSIQACSIFASKALSVVGGSLAVFVPSDISKKVAWPRYVTAYVMMTF